MKKTTGRSPRFDGDKIQLLLGGSAIRSLTYERASKALTFKSVDDQRGDNLATIERYHWTLAGSYMDNSIGASRRTAESAREGWEEVVAHIESDRPCDVLIVCDLSRETRDLAVFAAMRDRCYRAGMFFWMVAGTPYDLRDKNDRMWLGMQAVQSEWTSDSIADNVTRALAANAVDGVPHGKAPFGFARRYNERTRRFVAQFPDETERVTASGYVWTPAGVVREIIDWLLKSRSLMFVACELNARGIPCPRMLAALEGNTPRGLSRWNGDELDKAGRPRRAVEWESKTVREIALNPAYIGDRYIGRTGSSMGELTRADAWPAIVDKEPFWAVVSMLRDPRRKTAGPQQYATRLLVGIARCGVCGSTLTGLAPNKRYGRPTEVYKCRSRAGCVAGNRVDMDALVEAWIVRWIITPGSLERLQAISDTANATAAAERATAERYEIDLAQWSAKLDDPNYKPDENDHDRHARALRKAIDEANKRARSAGLKSGLRPFLGSDARAAARIWRGLDLLAQRDIVRDLVSVRLHPAGKGRRRSSLALDDPRRLELTALVV